MQYSKFQSFCALLSVWACLAAVPAKAQFTFTTTYITTNEAFITITGYTGAGGDVTIPSTINGYPVTSIYGGWLTPVFGINLTSVTIPNSVTNIGDDAFNNCVGLTSVTIPNSVINIGDEAFYNCYGLTNLTIGNRVTSIGVSAFISCLSLPSVTIPNSVTNIGAFAFADCWGLTNVTIGNSVISIGEYAFYDCDSLTSVTVPNSVTTIGDKAFDIHDDFETFHQIFFQGNAPNADSTVFSDVVSLGTVYVLPGTTGWGSTFGGWPVVSAVPNIIIQPATQTGRAEGSVSFAVTASGLPPFAYQWYFNSRAIIGAKGTNYILAGLTTNNAGNYSVIITNLYGSVTSSVAVLTVQPPFTFTTNAGTISITSYTGTNSMVVIPRVISGLPVTSIGDEAFEGCSSLTSVTVPNSVISIGNYAFYDCYDLTNLTIGNSVTSIGGGAFANCSSLTSVTIPNSVTSIGFYAFYDCYDLTNVAIGNSVISIGEDAFWSCDSLTSVTIPKSVTNIDGEAFAWCSGLGQVYFQGDAPTVVGAAGSADTSVFEGESGTAYYLPGTTGWGATFGGWPTAQWYQPQPQILGTGLGVHGSQFNFTISWATNVTVVVEASTNLKSWTPLITNTLVNGTNGFGDAKWTNYPQRFYRVRSQ